MKKKPLTMYANESELKDFEWVKQVLERNSESDTIRAMISFCKKNLSQKHDVTCRDID